MAVIQICQTETVYRYHRIDRDEAIRILAEEWGTPVHDRENLNTLTDQELCALLLGHIEEGDDIHDYLDSEVVEKDSGVEWDIEVLG